MRKSISIAFVTAVVGLAPMPAAWASPTAVESVPFSYTGDHQTWVVPAGICTVEVDAFGAQGTAGYTPSWPPPSGGKGAEAKAALTVTPGETLQVNVGGRSGFNGGGPGGRGEAGGAGGGASDVTRDPSGTPTRLIVAGGGGGGAAGAGGQGGPGGDAGQTGTAGTNWAGTGGGGGTATGGGTGGAGGNGASYAGGAGSDGSLGVGGAGGDGGPNGGGYYGGGGGGGGGGYYGGGGGGGGDGSPSLIFFGAGGGGGSSYGPAGTTFTSGAQSGDGQVTISYDPAAGGCPDTTPPTSSITLNPSTPTGNAGWYTGPVGVTVTASDASSTVSATNCVLDPAAAPTAFADIPAGCAYATGTNVTTDGMHTIYAASEDSSNNQETPVSTSFKIDATPPSVSFSDCPTSVPVGSSVTVHWTASDATSGLVSAASGSIPLDTSTPGTAAITAPTATDAAGNTTSNVSCRYSVGGYAVSKFLSPHPNAAFKPGKTVHVTVKVTLNGTALPDRDAVRLAAACAVTFSASGVQPVTSACMKYSVKKHEFVYDWKIRKSPHGTDHIWVTLKHAGSTVTNPAQPVRIYSGDPDPDWRGKWRGRADGDRH